jgi:hypothetical protein
MFQTPQDASEIVAYFPLIAAAEAPRTNHQIPRKLQTSNTKLKTLAAFEGWNLKLPWWLEFGIWSFVAGPQPQSPKVRRDEK